MPLKTAHSYTSSDSQYCSFSSRRISADKIVYNILDERGTVLGQVQDGQVISKLQYSAYGQQYVKSQATDTPLPKFGYTGMRIEDYTGMYLTHYRWYDWRTHRWDREDPAGYVDGLNLYAAYFDVNGVDPTGLFNQAYINEQRKMGRKGGKSLLNYLNPLDSHFAPYALLGAVWYGAGATSDGVQEGMETFRNETLPNANLPQAVETTLAGASYASEAMGVGSSYAAAGLTSLPVLWGAKGAAPHVGRYYLNANREYWRVALANSFANAGVGGALDYSRDGMAGDVVVERALVRFVTSYLSMLTIGGKFGKNTYDSGVRFGLDDHIKGGFFNMTSGVGNDYVLSNFYGDDFEASKFLIYGGTGALATPFGQSKGLFGSGLSELFVEKSPFIPEAVSAFLTEMYVFLKNEYDSEFEE